MKIIKILAIIVSVFWALAAFKNKYKGNNTEALWNMCWLIVMELAILM